MAKEYKDINKEIDELTGKEFIKKINEDPAFRQRVRLFAENDPAMGKLKSKLGSAFDSFVNAIGIGEGYRQRSYGERKLDQLDRPTMSPTRGLDKGLSRMLDKARLGFESPEMTGALTPYESAIREAYGTGLETAKTASGGQAGSFGSQAQALYNQRLKQSAQLPAVLEKIRGQYGNLATGLSAQRQAEEGSIAREGLFKDRIALDQYNREAEAYGSLAAQGRENIATGLGALGRSATPLLAPAFMRGSAPSQASMAPAPIMAYGNSTENPMNAYGPNPGAPTHIDAPEQPYGFSGIPEFDDFAYDITTSNNNRYRTYN